MLHLLTEHRYVLLFATAFANQVVLFVPVVPVLISAGALAARHQLDVRWAILALATGIAPADFVWYLLGRRAGGRVLGRVCRVALEPESCVRTTKKAFSRYGARMFVFAKFIPGLSTVAMPVAGVVGLRPQRFLAYDTLGAFLWTTTYVLVGYGAIRQVGAIRFRPQTVVATAVAVMALYIASRYVQRRRFVRQLKIRRMDPADLKAKLDRGEQVTVVDVRHEIELATDPHTIPGALCIPAEQLRERHREIPRDREVVLFCT